MNQQFNNTIGNGTTADDLNMDNMAPDASPSGLSKKSGVRRVNNVPMYLLASVFGLFLLVMALVAADRSAKQNTTASEGTTEKANSASIFANEIVGNQTEGIIAPSTPLETIQNPIPALIDSRVPTAISPMPSNPALLSDSGKPILIARPDDLNSPPIPPPSTGESPKMVMDGSSNDVSGRLSPAESASDYQLDQSTYDDEAARIRMTKMQMLEEAVKARTSVQVLMPSSSSDASNSAFMTAPKSREGMLAQLAAVRQQIDAQHSDDPTAAYQAKLEQIRSSGIGGSQTGVDNTGSSPLSLLQKPSNLENNSNDYTQFSSSGERWKMNSQLEAPRSLFELRAGFVIPAMLISGINSDLPGQIMAQVSQSVYDTPTGKYVLIPQGARLIGMYSSDIAYGQSRLMIAWQRIVFPDGKAMDIGSMPGSDSAGYTGFKDQINNHYFRLFASAFLMSGVTAGIAMSQPDGSNSINGRPTATSAMTEALGQQLGQVAAALIAKNLNVSPTLDIRPGYRFNVIVTKDMTFPKPYRSFDY